MRSIQVEKVRDAVRDMCIEANYSLSPDMRCVFEKACQEEKSPLGRQILNQLSENLEIAKKDEIPICQDTGMAVVFLEVGQEVHFEGGSLEEAVQEGTIESKILGIEEILAEWERTRHAAEVALQEAEQQKLESAKAKALQEAGDIMGRLADVMPKLDPDFAQKGLLEEPNIAGNPIEEDKAAQMVANMNQLLQQEIDRLSNENARMDEKLAAAAAGTETVYQEEPETFAAPGVMELTPEAGEEQMPQEDVLTQKTKELPKITLPDEYEPLEEEFVAEEPEIPEADEEEEPEIPETDEEAFETEEPEGIFDEETVEEEEVPPVFAEEEDLPEIELPEEEAVFMQRSFTKKAVFEKPAPLPEIEEPDEDDIRNHSVHSLTGELREIFTYFVSIKGMEKQI